MIDEPNDIAFVYDPALNTDGSFLDGVPRRSLTLLEYNELPERWQTAVVRTPYYVSVNAPSLALVSIDGVGQEITTALANAGYKDWTAVNEASDDDLLKISGIGKMRLSHIRAAITQYLAGREET